MCCVIFLSACSNGSPESARTIEPPHDGQQEETTSFEIGNSGVEASFDSSWKQESDTPYDLQCGNGSSYAGFFGYEKDDLAEGSAPMDIYDKQNEQIFSSRTNVKLVEEGEQRSTGGKTVYTTLYSAELDGTKNFYYCGLIQFDESDEVFVYAMFTSLPSDIEENRPAWDEILDSVSLAE